MNVKLPGVASASITRVDAPVSNGVDEPPRVVAGVARQRRIERRHDSKTRETTIRSRQPHMDRRRVRIGPLTEPEPRMRVAAGERRRRAATPRARPIARSTPSGRSSSVAIDCGARSRYVSSARAIGMRGSSRHSLSPLIHSRPSIGASQSCQLQRRPRRSRMGGECRIRRADARLRSHRPACPRAGTATPAGRSPRSARRSC